MKPVDLMSWGTMAFVFIVLVAMGLNMAKSILGIGEKPPTCPCKREGDRLEPTP